LIMQNLLYYLLVFCLVLGGCAPSQKTTGTQGGKYHEDLSGVRPPIDDEVATDSLKSNPVKRDTKTYVETKYTVNQQLDTVLDSIDRINLKRQFIDGFTIQVYSGLKRDEALLVKKDLTLLMPDLEADVHYNQPNFRVRGGKYFTQLEAQKDFQTIKAMFPNAIIVPDKISIK